MSMFGMVIANFLINNKDIKVKIFKTTFLLANVNLDVIFKMFFFILTNANVKFLD